MYIQLAKVIMLIPFITLGCGADAHSLPDPTEIYMEMSMAGKSSFTIIIKWDGRRYESLLEGSFLVGGRESSISNQLEATIADDGRPLTVSYRNIQMGVATTTECKLEGDKLLLKTTMPDGSHSEKELDCPPGTYLQDMADLVAGKRLSAGKDELILSTIDMEQQKTAEIEYKVTSRTDDGFIVKFSRKDMPLMGLIIVYDQNGEVISAKSDALRLEMKRISKEQALNHKHEALDIDTLTYVQFEGEMVANAKKLRITLHLAGSDLSGSVSRDAPGQSLIINEDNSITVTIVAQNKPSGERKEIPTDVMPYLASTSNVPWTDPAIQEVAKSCAPDDATPWVITRMATSWVGAKLDNDRPERAILTAKEALDRGAGDCTEHAVLLTALLRARGIPARLAAGIAYIGGRFGFHMWTLAWVGGDWVATDAMFGYAPIPADRVTMTLVGPRDRLEEVAGALLPALGQLEIVVEEAE